MANNEENLISLADRTKEEQRAIARMGGIASGKARKRKKLMAEQIDLLFSLPLKNEKAKKQLEALGVDAENIDNQMAMLVSMLNTALSNDKNKVAAATFLRDTVGEKPKDQVEADVTTNNGMLDGILQQLKE